MTYLAIDAYVKALEINPNDKRGLYNLGNIFKELSQLEEALQQFEFILSKNPTDIETIFAKGMIYYPWEDTKKVSPCMSISGKESL